MMKGFLLTSNQIEILKTPNEFYNTILSLIGKAKKRISITSLYLGTGNLEKKVVECIEKKAKKNGIELNIIMDKNRCERIEKGKNSLTLLSPLSKHLYLYNNINSSHLPFTNYLPSMLKELLGVFHTKIIVSDNDIMITGANFSNSYFTTRKDRYMFIRNHSQLSNYLYDYTQSIKSIKYNDNRKDYIFNHREALQKYINNDSRYDIDRIIKSVPNDRIMLYPLVRYFLYIDSNEKSQYKRRLSIPS